MARKKTTQKQKQKQTVSQRQQVSQKVVVQVDTRRRRKATTKRRPKQAAAEQPMFMMPPQAAPVPPAFFDPSAMEMNRRLQLLGDDLEVLKIQEASRRREMERPDGVVLGAVPAPERTDIPSHIREAFARLGAQLEGDERVADIVGSNIRQLKREMGMSYGSPIVPPSPVASPRIEMSSGAMSMADLRTPFKPALIDVPERHIKAEGSNAPFSQPPIFAVEQKGKEKEIANRIRENQQMPLGITVPVEPAVFDVSTEPAVVVGEAPKRGRSRAPKQKPAEPFEPRRSARIAEMEAARQGLVNPIFGRQQPRVVIGQQPEEKIDL
jgi:hypothetical protein